jgi:dihydrofolate reductase
MIVSAIVAAAENNAIGKNNQLPWYLPEDLKFFKRTTLGKPVLMGRKTYESLGKPLPGRLNIVMSKQKNIELPDGVLQARDLSTAMETLEQQNNDEVFIIGGGKIFEETLQDIDRLYMTRVHTTIPDADVFFPHIDHSHWKLAWEEPHTKDEKHAYDFTFQRWERVKEI